MTDTGVHDWVKQLGITDRDTGRACATAARQLLINAARAVLGSSPSYTTPHLVFSGFVARAQGLHEAAVAAIEADNPYAAFTLLRAYAENAAAILYLKDHPTKLDRFWREPKGVPVGRINNHANSRFGMFKEIYDQLSQYAHPQPRSILASTRVSDDGTFTWSSAPSFKGDGDAIMACAWTVELARATYHLLMEFGELITPPSVADTPTQQDSGAES